MNYQHPERCVFSTQQQRVVTRSWQHSLQGFRRRREADFAVGGYHCKLRVLFFRWFLVHSLKRDPTTGLCTGIGFCEFADEETAELAKRMNNKKSIKGRLLRIDNPDGGKKGVVAAVV